MSDTPLGTIELSASTRLVFTIGRWKGRQLANVRKHVASARYTGPTKSGLAMTGNIVVALAEALTRLRAEIPGTQQITFARIPKGGGSDIVVTVIPPDDLQGLPKIDVREYVDAPSYQGPTQKGVRFPWDKLAEVTTLLQSQARQLGQSEAAEPTLFPDAKPSWVEQANSDAPSKAPPRDAILAEILPDGPKDFPSGFVNPSAATTTIALPTQPIFLSQGANGEYVVQSNFGFRHAVRNPSEGNFIVYAFLRAHREINVPTQMIEIFRTVKAYENYLRELRHAMLQAYERKSGHRPIAEHQTREVFATLGLPWLQDT
jgi:hypothetical protein